MTGSTFVNYLEGFIEECVDSPQHYDLFPEFGLEVLDLIENRCEALDNSSIRSSSIAGFYYGNVLKYTTRFMYKGGVQDLKKAVVYLNYLTQHLESGDEVQSTDLEED